MTLSVLTVPWGRPRGHHMPVNMGPEGWGEEMDTGSLQLREKLEIQMARGRCSTMLSEQIGRCVSSPGVCNKAPASNSCCAPGMLQRPV